jgi:hypothetical protein
MTDLLGQDLNNTIANAVTARIEAEVTAALAGSEVMNHYVAAALSQPIEVKDPRTYRTRTTTYLKETIDAAIKEATKVAIAKVIAAEQKRIERTVRDAIRDQVDFIGRQLVASLVEKADSAYGIQVTLRYGGEEV